MSIQDMLDHPEFMQRIFHPRKQRTATPDGARDYDIPVSGNASLGARWYIGDAAWPTVLAFHGNGEIVSDYDDIARMYHQIRLNLFMTDYRGYGWSTGSPTLSTYYTDADAVADFALRTIRAESPSAPVFLFGRSLGSGPASHLAATRADAFAGVVLESGFADIVPLLELLGIPPGAHAAELSELYSNHLKLRHTTLPVLILHGADDFLIPPEHARRNFQAVPHAHKRLEIITGAGHNDILMYSRQYFGALQEFTERP
ncbi:MAG: alpha/beta fold hydrolase [Leptospiraceae bacterium]|nr:alpha/beta fold hydrolase [Leptospiraceae bacterium]